MGYLQIQLPSGSWRYVTRILDNDIQHSIYSTRALEGSDKNIKLIRVIANNLNIADKINVRISEELR